MLGRDFTRTGFFALASWMTSSALMRALRDALDFARPASGTSRSSPSCARPAVELEGACDVRLAAENLDQSPAQLMAVKSRVSSAVDKIPEL